MTTIRKERILIALTSLLAWASSFSVFWSVVYVWATLFPDSHGGISAVIVGLMAAIMWCYPTTVSGIAYVNERIA